MSRAEAMLTMTHVQRSTVTAALGFVTGPPIMAASGCSAGAPNRGVGVGSLAALVALTTLAARRRRRRGH